VTSIYFFLTTSLLDQTITGHKNEGNDHQKRNDLTFQQILPTSTIRNIWGTERRMCMLILGLKGLILSLSDKVKTKYMSITVCTYYNEIVR